MRAGILIAVFLLVAVCGFTSESFAKQGGNKPDKTDNDWTVFGTDMYSHSDITGNVGIGTSSPQGKLDINGSLAIEGNTGTEGQVLTSQGASSPVWTTPFIDGIPSRIAGDPGVDTGTWSTPYTDAAKATDGDYSTYASGSVTSTDLNVAGYVTWDMGKIYDISVISLKVGDWDNTANDNPTFLVRGSQDNLNWSPVVFTNDKGTIRWWESDQTFLLNYRSRYIRIECIMSGLGTNEFRIYEIKVR